MDNNQPFISYSEKRPWGEFIRFTHEQPSTVKIITVSRGEAFSLQTHSERDEFWYVLSGNGKITNGDQVSDIEIGKEFFIPRGNKHRIEAGSEDVKILEIAFGHFKEEDIVRLEDKYNRS
jgi:mannose-6-phosphate isomerase-like protein (cupin superfamily)